jgi:hypothetical protein
MWYSRAAGCDHARMEIVSLTGPGSHRLERVPGVGSCTLGPRTPGAPRPDLEVAPGDRLEWSAFDRFSTPAGSPWPRWFGYEGDDTGWVAWSTRRPIEGFAWTPHAAHDLDAGHARIGGLSVTLRRNAVRLVLPEGRFSVIGDLTLLTPLLAPGADCPPLRFHPDTTPVPHSPLAPPVPHSPYALPELPALAGAASVAVSVPPLRQPFDCASLLQFPGLRHLELAGSLTRLDALAGLPGLTGLHLRYVPDLSELPPLDAWPPLTQLIAWNVDDRAGRRLRTELRRGDREWRDSSVSKLRTPAWFATEYGLPFSGWPPRSARTAVKAFRIAEAAVRDAATEAAVEEAVRGFVGALNRLPRIETTEREDAAAAVGLLTADTPLGDLSAVAASWLDAFRDF